MKYKFKLLIIVLLSISNVFGMGRTRILVNRENKSNYVSKQNPFNRNNRTRLTPKVDLKSKRDIVDVKCLKNTFDCFAKNQTHLSPIHGAAWYESDMVKNFYEAFQAGEKNDATTTLVSELFYLQDDVLYPTKHKTKPGFVLTPELIAQIISYLEKKLINNTTVF